MCERVILTFILPNYQRYNQWIRIPGSLLIKWLQFEFGGRVQALVNGIIDSTSITLPWPHCG